AEARVAGIGRIARQRELVVAGAEEAVPLDRTVGDVEHVVAAAEADVADDARRRDAGGDRGLLHGRAAVVGRQVDRDVPVGRGGRAARADRAAVFDRIDGPRQIDDRSRRTAVAAGLGGDRAAVADQRDIAAG